jgi:hypothetical protein
MIGRYPVTDDTAGNLSCSHSPFGPVYESPTIRSSGSSDRLPMAYPATKSQALGQ